MQMHANEGIPGFWGGRVRLQKGWRGGFCRTSPDCWGLGLGVEKESPLGIVLPKDRAPD